MGSPLGGYLFESPGAVVCIGMDLTGDRLTSAHAEQTATTAATTKMVAAVVGRLCFTEGGSSASAASPNQTDSSCRTDQQGRHKCGYQPWACARLVRKANLTCVTAPGAECRPSMVCTATSKVPSSSEPQA